MEEEKRQLLLLNKFYIDESPEYITIYITIYTKNYRTSIHENVFDSHSCIYPNCTRNHAITFTDNYFFSNYYIYKIIFYIITQHIRIKSNLEPG